MEAERDALTTSIAMLSPGAPENTTVANITAFNENVTRASELRKEIVYLEWQRPEHLRKRDQMGGGSRTSKACEENTAT